MPHFNLNGIIEISNLYCIVCVYDFIIGQSSSVVIKTYLAFAVIHTECVGYIRALLFVMLHRAAQTLMQSSRVEIASNIPVLSAA